MEYWYQGVQLNSKDRFQKCLTGWSDFPDFDKTI